MVEEVQMTLEEAIEYVRNEVHVTDIMEISYNRIFAPGEVLGITEEDEVTGEGLRVGLQLTGEILNQSIEVDLNELTLTKSVTICLRLDIFMMVRKLL